jgi:hypothetical protein
MPPEPDFTIPGISPSTLEAVFTQELAANAVRGSLL